MRFTRLCLNLKNATKYTYIFFCVLSQRLYKYAIMDYNKGILVKRYILPAHKQYKVVTKVRGDVIMDFQQYLIDKALILIPCLLIIGQVIKTIPKVPNWIIPFVLLILGIIGGMFLVGFDINGVIQGILVAGTAVFGNQLWKQGAEGIKGGGN